MKLVDGAGKRGRRLQGRPGQRQPSGALREALRLPRPPKRAALVSLASLQRSQARWDTVLAAPPLAAAAARPPPPSLSPAVLIKGGIWKNTEDEILKVGWWAAACCSGRLCRQSMPTLRPAGLPLLRVPPRRPHHPSLSIHRRRR